MLARGGGAFVNMASTAGVSGGMGITAYVTGKHGIIGLTKSAALDYAACRVRINVAAPGPILTGWIAALDDSARQPIVRAVPMQRIGLPEQVAQTAAWLCSEDASFITGAAILVDGGWMAGAAGY